MHPTTKIRDYRYEQRRVTKGVIRIRKSKKDRQHKCQKLKGQTTIYSTLYIKLKIEQHEPH